MYKAIRKSTQHRKYPLPDGPWVMTLNGIFVIHVPASVPGSVGSCKGGALFRGGDPS